MTSTPLPTLRVLSLGTGVQSSVPPLRRSRTSTPLVGAPVIRRGSQWWLVTSSGSLLATDPIFTGELDRFAAARAAADQAVARLRSQRDGAV